MHFPFALLVSELNAGNIIKVLTAEPRNHEIDIGKGTLRV